MGVILPTNEMSQFKIYEVFTIPSYGWVAIMVDDNVKITVTNIDKRLEFLNTMFNPDTPIS